MLAIAKREKQSPDPYDLPSRFTNHRHPERRHPAGSELRFDPATAKSRSLGVGARLGD